MKTRNRLLVAVGSWVGIAVGPSAESIAHLRWSGRRAADVYKKTAVLVLNAIVCFACLELASASVIQARVALVALIGPGEQEVLDPRSASSYYSSQDWAPVYWREFGVSRRQAYRPYVLWRRHAFSGKTINVDAEGVRLTPGAVCGPSSFRVFVLGGSTVWGTGSADWNTLPAHLQTELQRVSARPVCVVNFGESAYVSTQSVLQLLLQLQAGNVPDLVISYEGYNDAFSAYQSGRAGVHENLAQLVATFEGTNRVEQSAIGRLMRSTYSYSLIADLLLRVTHPPEEEPKLLTYRTMGVDETALAASVVQTYQENYNLVAGLAQKYGFEFRFFWPPYIAIGRKPLVAEEQALARAVDPALDSLYHSVHRMIEAAAPGYSRISDLTGIFDDYSGLIWIDDMHVTPLGNQMLASKMTSVLRVSGQETGGRKD
ncbi:MAG TPA: SGNH/GDSL hydrolase family protein [Vicinamibacterales bacterium]|nr:SGNH/GDSL hydrolase family protein [Vicinamibacterales bacterium]